MSPATVLQAVAFSGFGVWGFALAVIDARTHRLPDVIVLPAYPVGLSLLGLACLLGAEPAALLRAVLAMAALFAFFFAMAMISPGAVGGGDVKLAGVLGIFLGWAGWPAVLGGLVAAFVLAGVFGLVLMAARRATRRTRIPFGPFLVIGGWIALALSWAATAGPAR